MQPTTYPNVSDIYATGAPSVVPSASGFTGPDVSNIYAAQNQSGSQPTAQQQPKKEKGNWFTNALPTIGSVAVPTLGALLAPATGGLSLVAAAGLSGLGAAGGKLAENALEGNDATDDLLLSTAEGAAGGAVGGVAGKVLGKGAKYLARRAGDITDTATTLASKKAAQESELATAQAIRNNYGSVSEKLQSDSHLALGSNQKLLQELGYDHTDPYKMAKAAEAGYHPTDLSLNSIYDEALREAKPIQTSDINTLFGGSSKTVLPGLTKQEIAMLSKAGISPEVAAKGTINSVGAPVATGGIGATDPVSPLGKVLSDFSERTNGIYGKGAGLSLPENIPATDVRKLQQAVGKEMRTQQTLINNAANNGVSNVEAESAHNTLSKIYDQLGGRIKTPEVDASIAARVTTPEERSALVEKFGTKHGNQIADTIDNADVANDILAPMKNYTQMGQASDMAINDIENVTAGTRAIARTKADINGDGIADASAPLVPTTADALNSAANGSMSGGPISTIAKALYQSKDNPAILNTLSRIGALGKKLAPATGAAMGAGNAQLQSNSDTMGGMMPPAQNTDPGLMASSTMPAGGLMASSTTPAGGLSRDDLITLALYSPSAFNSLVTPSAQQQQGVTAANTAQQALGSLGPAPTGGIMSQLAGKLGLGPTGEYQRKAAAAAQQVAAALPGTDAGTIEKQLTNYLAGGASIDQAVAELMKNLQATAQNNTNAPYQSLMNFHPSVVSAAGL